MADFNEGIFSGRIAKKEVRVSGDLKIVNISLAVNYYDRKEKREAPMYIPVSVFGKQAEALEQYADVGDQLFVKGEWRPNRWENKQTHEKHYELRLSATNLVYGRKKGDRSGASAGTSTSTPAANSTMGNPMDGFYPMDEELEDDDLPF